VTFELDRYEALRTARWVGAEVVYRETTGSTMDDARAGAARGGAAGTAYVAGAQHAGRGRQGRGWVSAAAAGLWVTFQLRTADVAHAPLYSAAGALAVADGVQAIADLTTELKWPNDVLAGGRKLAGVLAESQPAAGASAARDVLLGIGLNLRRDAVPPELAATATSVEQERGAAPPVEAALAAVAAALERWVELLAESPAGLVAVWRERLGTLGRRVRLAAPGGAAFEGEAIEVTPQGELVLRGADGALTRHAAGDVSLRDAEPAGGA
jgi:BirA family biotin operon repressor/biotin-[acetyl-CoA-carboxylase] ligase